MGGKELHGFVANVSGLASAPANLMPSRVNAGTVTTKAVDHISRCERFGLRLPRERQRRASVSRRFAAAISPFRRLIGSVEGYQVRTGKGPPWEARLASWSFNRLGAQCTQAREPQRHFS